MNKQYHIIGGFEVNLDTRVGKIEEVYRIFKWYKVLVLPFRLVLPLPDWLLGKPSLNK